MAFTPGFIQEEAQETMTLCAISYAYDSDQTKIYDLIKLAIENYLENATQLGQHWHLVWLGITLDYGNLMYVARDDREPARYAIVMRGSAFDFFDDYKDDFDVLTQHDWPTASPYNPAIRVAQGSWDGLETLLALQSEFSNNPQTIAAPISLVDFLKGEISKTSDETDVDIFVTGHSLGGALAIIFGLWLADTIPSWHYRPFKMNLKTYTFAAPTSGNADYATYYNSRANNSQICWQSYRVFSLQDVVPRGYSDVMGVVNNGIPLGTGFLLELAIASGIVQSQLPSGTNTYAHVDDATHMLVNDPLIQNWLPAYCDMPGAPASCCARTVEGWEEYANWVEYEHETDTYLSLFQAPPLNIPEIAVDKASMAATALKPLGIEAKLKAETARLSGDVGKAMTDLGL